MKLEGKVVLITGAASGIGRASTLLFSEEGAKVVAVGFDRDGGEETVKLIRARGGDCIFIEADVSRGEDVETMIGRVVEAYGRIDVMFNNAGVGLYKPLSETIEEDWGRVIDVNLKGAFLGCKHAANQMLKQGGRSHSQHGLRDRPDWRQELLGVLRLQGRGRAAD